MTLEEEEEVLQHIAEPVELPEPVETPGPVPMEVSIDHKAEIASHPEETRTATQSIPNRDDIHVDDGEYAAPHNLDIDLPPDASSQQEQPQVSPSQQQTQLLSSIPPCLVPGFWFATVGKPQPDVLDLEFVVDEESASSALRWGKREKSFSFECVSSSFVPLLLL